MMKHAPIVENLAIGQNSFGLLRLLAASAVVVSHAWVITGGTDAVEPLFHETGFSLGWHAVNLFFALSGLLIAGSLYKNPSLVKFVWSRGLRIFPALIVVVLATLVFAAMSVDTSEWTFRNVSEYLVRNFLLVGASASLPGVFEHNPSSGEINVPLWTLKYEVAAYATVAALITICRFFNSKSLAKLTTVGILFGTAAIMFTFGDMAAYGKFEHAVRLLFAFYLGVAAWHWRDKIIPTFLAVVLFCVINVALILQDIIYAPAQIAFVAFAALWLGTRNYGAITRFTDKQDYSYGIYIIGFPIQQIVMTQSGNINPWFNVIMSMLVLVPLAALSWNLVERPALRLKNIVFNPAKSRRNAIALSGIKRIGASF